MDSNQLHTIVTNAITELGFEDCYVVEVVIASNKIEVFLDSTDGVTFAKCRRISRLVEEHTDADPQIPEKYTLDVSSAGIGRPLKLVRQYIKNIGRDIEVKTIEGNKYLGTMLSANEDEIVLEVLKDPKSKKKIKETEKITVAMNKISQSKIKVRF